MAAQSNAQLAVFADYLSRARRPQERPAQWRWQEIDAALASYPHGERGTAALVSRDRDGGGEVAPGLSLAVQTVLPHSGTTAHRHSFWHLYWVAAGAGELALADEAPRPLSFGDVVYVPPWCMHTLSNQSDAPLLLFALQNLPQLAALGALMREADDGARVSVHATDGASAHR